MTWRAWLQQAIAALQGGESPRRDAEILLGHVTGKSRTQILAFDETELSAAQVDTPTVSLSASLTVTTKDSGVLTITVWLVPPATLMTGAWFTAGALPPQPPMITSSKDKFPVDFV